jgi:hypothetical protein
LLITLAAVVAIATSGSGNDARAELEYLDAVQEEASALATKGAALGDVASRLARIDRTELVTVIDGLRADLAAGLELAEQAPPSETLFAVNALHRQALAAWDAGVSGLGSALLVAADDPTSTVVVDNIANALGELRAGDRLYQDMLIELAREEVPDPAAPMPQVVLMPTTGGLTSLAQAYVLAARSPESNLALRPGLAVSQVATEPEWEVNPEDVVIVPNTDTLTFNVVVSNLGNVISPAVSLNFELSTEEQDPVIFEEPVPTLEPQQQTTISFPDIDVDSGESYEVALTLIGVQTDVNADDNEKRVEFTVSEG